MSGRTLVHGFITLSDVMSYDKKVLNYLGSE